MKTKLFFFVAYTIGLFTSNGLNAQPGFICFDNKMGSFTQDTIAQVQLFAAKFVEGKTYLHWDIVKQHSNGTYIVYKSYDGKNYELLGIRQGIGVPVYTPISYYLLDETPCEGTTYYRLMHLGSNKTFLLSKVVIITIDRLFPGSKKGPYKMEMATQINIKNYQY